ncbi:MAG TPA: MFS transporter [Stellaceae bacterium]|nr:MFS transporter [Stellaceae bacterium]
MVASSKRVVQFINVGHALDHFVMLIFPTAVLGMGASFGRSYGELLSLSLGGFIAFGAGSLPAGWLGDRWSRRNMMALFFFGVGAATMLTAFVTTPFMLAASLTLVGAFAAIYHPVGTAMLTAHATERLGRTIGVNGVWGNLGVAFAALASGALTYSVGWRWAFAVPGLIAIALGVAFLALIPDEREEKRVVRRAAAPVPRGVMVHAFAVLVLVTLTGSVVFNAVSVSLPKVFAERLPDLSQMTAAALDHAVQLFVPKAILDMGSSAPLGIGALAFVVFTIGAVSQLIVGHFVDRHPLRTVFLPLSVIQAPCLLLAAWAHEWAMLLLAIGVMFGIFGQVTINDAMVARYTNQEWRARAYAFRYIVSFGASACGVPLVAILHDRTGGFEIAFLVLACLGACVFLGALLFPHRPEELDVLPARVQPAE